MEAVYSRADKSLLALAASNEGADVVGHEAIEMAIKLFKTTDSESGRPPVGIGTFFVIVGMAVLFFLLAQAMVSHRFFRGGHDSGHGYVVQ
jgi:hypothetical protein